MTVSCPVCDHEILGPSPAVDAAVKVGHFVRDGETIRLTPLEHAMLQYLYDHECEIVRYESLIERLWGDDPDGGPLTAKPSIKVLLHHLRAKVGQQYVRVVWGYGVTFSRNGFTSHERPVHVL